MGFFSDYCPRLPLAKRSGNTAFIAITDTEDRATAEAQCEANYQGRLPKITTQQHLDSLSQLGEIFILKLPSHFTQPSL